jgi:hypothetical protein
MFATVRSEGGLLPPDLLARIAANDPEIPGLAPEDYGLGKTDRLNEAASRAWERVKAYWAAFEAARQGGGVGVTETREQWLLPLFRELGYGRLVYRQAAEEVGGRRYAISHQAGEGPDAPPVHTVSVHQPIERAPATRETAPGQLRMSPHGLLQDYLNRTDHLWGVVTNGLQLRLLRDNLSLSRPAYVEFDLEAMLNGGVYADFVLLFLVAHRSRLPAAGSVSPQSCWLERWRVVADEQGTRALDALRDGVTEAIKQLGQGLLAHPANEGLREALREGRLPVEGYYRQLLRLVYRLIFLLAVEERDLLFPPGTEARRREVYRKHYGVSRLRDLVEQRRHADRYDDLWRSLQVVFAALRAEGAGEPLGLAPLAGGVLFGAGSCPDVDGDEATGKPAALVGNVPLLLAIRGLTYTKNARTGLVRRVNYRDMDVEELGSVYESLLELQPRLEGPPERRSFALGASGERKSTGSYYTNPGLVRELIKSALDPVIAEAMARGRTVAEQRANLLALRVCDPACGSGHFLLAAARRIGREMARLDAGETEPDPHATRRAVREAIQHCVYGVDLNPLAVDLCKLALWLEGHDGGKPLGFLEHHVKQGNALIGATEETMGAGVPDGAFEPVTRDDKTYARAIKKRNAFERKGNQPLDYHVTVIEDAESLRRYLASLRATEETAAEVEAKATAYRRHQASPAAWRKRVQADLWTAGFFWPLRPEEPDPPTHGVWTRLADDPHLVDYITKGKAEAYRTTASYRTVRHARDLAKRYHFFHWEMEFEEVFAGERPGFDCVLGNPPWDQIQLDPQEFFRNTAPEIANALNMAARTRAIAGLELSDPTLHQSYMTALRAMECVQKFIHSSDRFPLSSFGRLNTAPLFAEAECHQIRQGGLAGMIVPTGIATDSFNQHFFRWLVESNRLISLFDFENRGGLFPGVDSRVKFSLLTVGGAGRGDGTFQAAFYLLQPSQVADPERRFRLTKEDIALLNPNTGTCPIFRTARDAEITRQLYRSAPVLVREGEPEESPWKVSFKLMFQMNTDSHLFCTFPEMITNGFKLIEERWFQRGEDVWLPLFEGKLFHQFDHRFASFVAKGDGLETCDVTENEHHDPFFTVSPRYWITEKEVVKRTSGESSRNHRWFIGFRNIARSTDERTTIFSLVPWAGVSETLTLILTDASAPTLAALLANGNAFAFDFIVRQKAGGIHLNAFIVKQVPVLPPETYTPELLAEIVPRVLELVYTAHDLAPFAHDCGYEGPPFRWDPERRAKLRAELDGIYAHLYGLSRDDFAYVLGTFPIVNRRDLAAFGEERTKRLCLEAYEQFVGVRPPRPPNPGG